MLDDQLTNEQVEFYMALLAPLDGRAGTDDVILNAMIPDQSLELDCVYVFSRLRAMLSNQD